LEYHCKTEVAGATRDLMLGYLRQAEAFSSAAENTPKSSRPLLYYYSFFNLSKALLATKYSKSDLESAQHGIVDPAEDKSGYVTFNKQKVNFETALYNKRNRLQIFSALHDHFSGYQAPVKKVKLLDLLQQIVGIHRAYVLATGVESSFIKIRKPEFIYDNKKKEVWLRFRLRDEDYSNTLTQSKILSDQRIKSEFKFVNEPTSNYVAHDCFEVSKAEGYGRSPDKAVAEIRKRMRLMGVHQLILYDESSYRYYLFIPYKDKIYWPHVIPMYAVMFYFSSVVRYRPYNFEKLLDKEYGWLIHEFLDIVPKQFLMIMANEITQTQLTHSID
jgi:hypothetical protein